MIPETWQIPDFKSEYILRAKAKALAEIEPLWFDCCVASCICYTGHYASLEKCPHCNEPRFRGLDRHGKPKPQA